MARTQYFVLSTWYAVLVLAYLTATAGCTPANLDSATAEPPEPSLDQQVGAVRSGESDRIQLEQTPVSDADLKALADLTGLRELLIDDARSQITASGIQHLAALPKLEHLRIRGSGIDGEALSAIAKLTELRILNVPRATFGDESLTHLKLLPHLENLRFGSRNVTDVGLRTLSELPSLQRLHLIDVPITDGGLRELAKIEQLESLYIDGAQLSDAAFDELFRQRPGLHIHINQQHHDRDPHAHAH